MGILNGLLRGAAQAAGVAGAGFRGYGQDQDDLLKAALAERAAKRQAGMDALDARLKEKQLAKIEPGEIGYGDYAAGNARQMIPVDLEKENTLAPARANAAALTAAATAPIDVKKATDIATETAPIEVRKAVDIARATPENHTPVVTTAADGGQHVSSFGTKSGTVTDTGAGAKTSVAGGGIGRAGIIKAIAENQEKLSIIDDALKELGGHESAVGLIRGIPFVSDAVNQRVDSAGVPARAQIANIGSMVIHDRSGAAVTVHEMPRLSPFVPAVTDKPEAIRMKLAKLKAAIQVETGALGSPTTGAPQGGGRGGQSAPVSEAAWSASNPPRAGESYDAYHARYLAAGGH